jgi:hypothetical protein
MKTLRRGARDAEVAFLQRCLNRAFRTDRSFPGLNEDGVFGQNTETWLRRFQTQNMGRHGINVVDGVAGPATWRAIGVTTEITHDLPRMGQTTGMTCWVVCGGLASRTYQSLLPATAVEALGGGLDPSLSNIEAFGRELGFRMLPMVPMSVDDLIPHLRIAPLMFGGTWSDGSRHMVVISGFYATADRETRMIRVHDPLPEGAGSIVMTEYPGMILTDGPIDPYCLLVR